MNRRETPDLLPLSEGSLIVVPTLSAAAPSTGPTARPVPRSPLVAAERGSGASSRLASPCRGTRRRQTTDGPEVGKSPMRMAHLGPYRLS